MSPSPTPDTYGPTCPIEVTRASMIQRWDLLTFLHWRYEPEVVQALLPPGLEVDTFEGGAWVGLVPFYMEVRPGRGPAIPWLSHFCETNVRTYATAPDGTRGVWFLSLDAERLPAVITARTTYRLPYFWSSMSIDHTDDTTTYTNRRRWPGHARAESRVTVRPQAPYTSDELTDFDHFLTAQWRLYSRTTNGLRYALAEHPVWPLQRVELLDLDDNLIASAGLPRPTGDPICHWSPGVEVRIGFPHLLPTLASATLGHQEGNG